MSAKNSELSADMPVVSDSDKNLSTRRKIWNGNANFWLYFCSFLTVALLVFLIGYICYRGIPHLTWQLISSQTSHLKHTIGILPNILNTIYIIIITMVIALPISVGAAIYLTEYAGHTKLANIIEFATETLSGIPSIIYGLVGMLIFIQLFGLKQGILAGGLTLVIMIMPVIIRTTQESLKTVPDSYREGSFGLGAGKLRTIFKIVLPAAAPGILAGVILGIGRVVGETAALIYTAGTVAQIPKNIMGSGRTLAVHMYSLWTEGMNVDQSYATAVILLVVVIILNFISDAIAKRVNKVNE